MTTNGENGGFETREPASLAAPGKHDAAGAAAMPLAPAMAVLLFSLAGFMSIGGALSALLGPLVGTTVAQAIFFVAAPAAALLAFKAGFGGLGVNASMSSLAGALFVPLFLFFFYQYQVFQEEYLFRSRDDLREIYEATFGVGTNSPFLIAVCVAVVPAVAEEFMFRGFLLSSLRGPAGRVLAVIASSAIFAAIHIEPVVIVPIFIFGLLLGSVTEITGSLLPAMLLHLANNLLVVLTLLDENLEHRIQSLAPAGMPWLAASLALSCAALFAIARKGAVRKTSG